MKEDDIQPVSTLIVGHIIAAYLAVALLDGSDALWMAVAIIVLNSQGVLFGQWLGLSA